tara:strand:- start:284 stop:1309 length:1026 start_codon:yes stop_codon:yes gene_type:complete
MADEITLPPSGSFDSNLSSDAIDREEALLEEQNFQQQEETKNAIQNKAVGVDVDAINAATPADIKQKGVEKFGKLILVAGLKFANRITPRIIKEIKLNFPTEECPTKEQIDKAITLRDDMVGQANQISKTLDIFSKSVLGVSKFLAIVITIIKGIKVAKAILAGIGGGLSANPVPNPIVNQILGAINTVVGVLDEVVQNVTFDFVGDSRLVKAKTGVDGAAIAISLASGYVANFIAELNKLDAKLQKCDPRVPLTEVDPQLRLLAEVYNEANASINGSTYKGFVIEVEEVEFTPTVNRRRAVGFTQDGVRLIETPLSFTTNEQILKQELKIIIDRDNLRAD